MFNDYSVRYLIAGAYAVMYHAEPRFTKDLDVWVEPTPKNAIHIIIAKEKAGRDQDLLDLKHLLSIKKKMKC